MSAHDTPVLSRTSWLTSILRPRFNRLEFGIVALLLVSACFALYRSRASWNALHAIAFRSPWGDASLVDESARVAPVAYRKPYEFTTDWFSHHVPVWEKALGSYKGKPGVQYLEVGLYEGRSALWMLENILTDPTSGLTGIDVFDGPLRDRYLANLKQSGQSDRAETIIEPSQDVLRRLPLNTYDIIYIDGSHATSDVLEDAVLSWRLLKPGGTLIFDDYQWAGSLYPGANTFDSAGDLPKEAIDGFVRCFRDQLEILHTGKQFLARKKG